MDQHRPGGPRVCCAQDWQQLVQIMTVERADVGKPQLLKQGAADRQTLDHFLGPPRPFLKRLGQQGNHAFCRRFQFLKWRTGVDPRQIRRHRTDWRSNGHLVVVQDDEHPFLQMSGVVQRLKRHTRRHRAIANHRDRIAGVTAQIGRHHEPKRRRDRGGTVRRPERIIGRLRPFGEPRQPAFGAQRTDTVAPSGQDLVRITLMAHVPDDLVARRIKNRMQGDGQLHHTQPGPQMPAGHGNSRNRFSPHLIRQLTQLRVGQRLHVGRQVNPVQQGRLW